MAAAHILYKSPQRFCLSCVVHCGNTRPGDTVVLVGALPELGDWQPSRGVRLDGSGWPTWKADVVLCGPPPAPTADGHQEWSVEMKAVIVRGDGSVQWEAFGGNRRLTAAWERQAAPPKPPRVAFVFGSDPTAPLRVSLPAAAPPPAAPPPPARPPAPRSAPMEPSEQLGRPFVYAGGLLDFAPRLLPPHAAPAAARLTPPSPTPSATPSPPLSPLPPAALPPPIKLAERPAPRRRHPEPLRAEARLPAAPAPLPVPRSPHLNLAGCPLPPHERRSSSLASGRPRGAGPGPLGRPRLPLRRCRSLSLPRIAESPEEEASADPGPALPRSSSGPEPRASSARRAFPRGSEL